MGFKELISEQRKKVSNVNIQVQVYYLNISIFVISNIIIEL